MIPLTSRHPYAVRVSLWAVLPAAASLLGMLLLPVGWDDSLDAALLFVLPLLGLWAIGGLALAWRAGRRRRLLGLGAVLAAGLLGVLGARLANSGLPIEVRAWASSRIALAWHGPSASPHVLADERTARRMFIREDSTRSTSQESVILIGLRELRLPRGTHELERGPSAFPDGPALMHHVRDGWWYVYIDRDDW